MSNQNLPILAKQINVAEDILTKLSLTQVGWLKLEHTKKTKFEELQKFELSAQGVLKDIIKETDLPKVQEALKKSKDILAEAKECRLSFTRIVQEKIIDAAMEFEKRINTSIEPVESHELELRVEFNKKADESAAKQREETALKTHITNEWYRIAAAYKLELSNEINKMYLFCLENKTPVKEIPAVIKTLKEALCEIKLLPFVKYHRTLVTDQEAASIFKLVPAFESKVELNKAVKKVDETFELYEHDLKNAEHAVDAIKEAQAEHEKETKEKLEMEISANNLSASAETLTMTGGPKTKIKSSFEVEDEGTEKYELAVLTNMIKLWKNCRPLIKSSGSKLNIGQMAVAIGKYVTSNPEVKNQITNLKFTVKNK